MVSGKGRTSRWERRRIRRSITVRLSLLVFLSRRSSLASSSLTSPSQSSPRLLFSPFFFFLFFLSIISSQEHRYRSSFPEPNGLGGRREHEDQVRSRDLSDEGSTSRFVVPFFSYTSSSRNPSSSMGSADLNSALFFSFLLVRLRSHVFANASSHLHRLWNQGHLSQDVRIDEHHGGD